jgi:hypothetical protein
MRNKYVSIWSLFLLVLLTPMLALANTSNSTSQKNGQQQVLFVVLSKQGSIHQIADKSGQYQLVLKGVNPEVIYFTDRPARIANHIALVQFLKRWSEGSFKTDPPNAVMEAVRFAVNKVPDKKAVNYAVVLTNPVYDAKKSELTFDIKPLSGSAPLPVVAKSDYLALFVDQACLSCF